MSRYQQVEIAAEMIATIVAGYHGVDLRHYSVQYGIHHNNPSHTHAGAMTDEVMEGAVLLIQELDMPKFERATEPGGLALVLAPSGGSQ